MGKTSITSRLNLPGRWGWFTMEIPGTLTLLYTVYSLPPHLGLTNPLPWGNKAMAAMFTIHYAYRAVLAPLLLNPSMAPIHLSVWLSALAFQVMNGLSIGGWLGGYGPTTDAHWEGRILALELGMVVWGWGLLANWWHDDDLREIRRAASRREKQNEKDGATGAADGAGADSTTTTGAGGKVYMLPKNGLFHYVLYAHYFCEWVEWCGYWIFGGLACGPARTFVVNEVASMLPRAWNGWYWYVDRFGRDKVGNRKAVIPGLI
jgi:3-oxo-5-alpha-steroid 4-dehydrogenase 1